MSNNDLDISVIIATYNRANILRETLEHMAVLDRDGINLEFVIVDNNSNDHTKQVITEFSSHLPLKYLFEPKPGQNCARNRALAEGTLGKLVVFTDDDVVPRKDWLKTILSISKNSPEYTVFGGKIFIIWPTTKIPRWALNRDVKGLAFAEHDYAETVCDYDLDLCEYPFSGNFWVRRQVLASGRRFDNTIAWCPGNRILATETILLRCLAGEGHRFLYCPQVVVGHRISTEQLSLIYLLKRAYSGGRAVAYSQSLCRLQLLEKHPVLWRLIRLGAIGRLGLNLAASLMPLALQKPQMSVEAMRWLGYNFESLKIADK